MEKKIVLITGASSGIGEGCARKFAMNGYRLILNGRNMEKLTAVKRELETEYRADVCLLPFDVRDRGAAKAALDSLPEEWKAIDILVNNAGLVIGVDKEHEGNLDEWDIVLDTNVKSLLALLSPEWWNAAAVMSSIWAPLRAITPIRAAVCIVPARLP